MRDELSRAVSFLGAWLILNLGLRILNAIFGIEELIGVEIAWVCLWVVVRVLMNPTVAPGNTEVDIGGALWFLAVSAFWPILRKDQRDKNDSG